MSKLLVVICVLFSVQSFAKVSCGGGVEFYDSVAIVNDNNQNTTLHLNGVGQKRVLFFNVFYAALYLEQLSQNGESIIQSKQHKVGIIHATMNIDKKRLVDMWNSEFDRLCGTETECQRLLPYHEQFISYARDVKKGERMYLIAFADRFEFEANQTETYPPIYSVGYSRLLQKSLIGPEPADAELKKGLLGQKQVCQ